MASIKNWVKITPHKLRHSYASHLYEATGDILVVKELLGHKRIETTMIYSHIHEKSMSVLRKEGKSLEEAIEVRNRLHTL